MCLDILVVGSELTIIDVGFCVQQQILPDISFSNVSAFWNNG